MTGQVEEAINLMKKRLAQKDLSIEMKGEGIIYQSTCTFNSPASDEEIQSFEKKTGLHLPGDYKEFLKITNGCRLFESRKSGGENDLYSLEDIINYTYEVPYEGCFKVACIYQDNIVINGGAIAMGDKEYIMVKGHLDDFEEGRKLHMSFAEWIERFLSDQGEKFWDKR
ncbi:SMI1/KNR4 family protein [Peribacillus sp. SI8-4]|uniref:SMI1/KNR4 family protein n=1 Tax=Peribacillus sp. SI8-4 TaxID=3048009 RepID=UPI002556533D|nr:SMI1/KNR4 family protein [Peribacillus sp. SI8-4]